MRNTLWRSLSVFLAAAILTLSCAVTISAALPIANPFSINVKRNVNLGSYKFYNMDLFTVQSGSVDSIKITKIPTYGNLSYEGKTENKLVILNTVISKADFLSLTYTSNSAVDVVDSFKWSAINSEGISAAVTTNINYASTNNNPPVVKDYTAYTKKNNSAQVEILANDADLDILSYTITSEPAQGTAVINTKFVTYTATNQTGQYTMDVTVSDGITSVVSTITIFVTDLTVDQNEINITILNNLNPLECSRKISAGTTYGNLYYSVDVEPDPVKGSVELLSDGTWTYYPNDTTPMTDTFTISVSDDANNSQVVIVNITVKEVTLPTITTEDPAHKGEQTIIVDGNIPKFMSTSFLNYTRIDNPDNYVLVTWGMYLTNVKTGEVLDIPVYPRKSDGGQFAFHIFGTGFITNHLYKIQAYLVYTDDAGQPQTVTSDEKQILWR